MARLTLALLVCGACASAVADVQLTMRDAGGRNTTMSSDGSRVRVDGTGMPGYMIIADGEVFMVDNTRQQIMRGDFGASEAGAASLDIRLKDKGGGEKVAGYLTRKYEFSANGETCGTIYASKKLLQQDGVRAMFESMRGLQQHSRGYTSGFGAMMPLCQRANLELADALEAAGVPLRIVAADGVIVSEITAVDTRKKFPSSHYQLPAGMTVVDMNEQMNQAAEQTQQLLQNMPSMDEIMQQMQGGDGQMTEETEQQMQKLQQMLQQLQQQ